MAYKKLSAYDKINNRFKKLSRGQSLEDRAKYWEGQKKKTQAQLDAFRKEHGTGPKNEEVMSEASSNAVDIFMIYQFIKRLATPFNKWPSF